MDKLAEIFQFAESKFKSAEQKIKGFMVIQKKNVLDLNDFNAGITDDLSELFGRGVSFQLVSASQIDSGNGIGKLSEKAPLQNWISTHEGILTGQTTYGVEFDWDSNFGVPGAFFITNSHHHEFFLNSLTLQVPGHGNVHFDCNSWVYPASKYNRDRVFFSNRSYLPENSPPALIKLRNEELRNLRGEYDGMAESERKECDRVYDYDYYNDLGNPDKNLELSRPVLGGSEQFPYPRRGRTGRPRTKTEPASESRLALDMSLDIYVPRDERFGHLKLSDFLAYSLKSVAQFLVPELKSLFDSTPNEFDSFEDVMKLYSDGIKLPGNPILDAAKNLIPLELIREFLTTDGQKLLKYPLPQVISNDKFAWRKDEEFARQTLAGVNPVVIQRLKSFPPRVKEYLSLYYQNDDAVKSDRELQAWWTEIRNVGHGDKKDETWWYSMDNVEDVEKAITTIIWVASALHAAVNFGQYPYAGYMPNRPTISRRLIPEEGSEEFSELVQNPDLFLLRTISNQFETTLGIALIGILSTHSTDEVYLGQRDTSEWSGDERVTEAFERFGMKLKELEKNEDAEKLKNRRGPAQVPYTLLYPNTSDVSHKGGLTGKGIPNSVSI